MGRRPPTARLDGAPERRQAEPIAADQPPARDLLIGAVIRDQYRLVERIGEGGMGVIYRAEQIQTGQALAIKLLHPELGRLTELVKRFEREAESVSRLSHPNIVKVVETGHLESGAVFLVMELLHGASLAQLLDDHARVPVDRAVAILSQVLSALDHAHSLGIIHRDLKPDNILLENPRDTVKILDFGIAKLREGSTESEMIKLTKAGIVLGTPAYMSPEQAAGNAIDHRSDLYTCGVVLFEMLTGVKPFVADKTMDVMIMHTSKPPPTPRSVAPTAGIPEALEAIVMRALDKDRDRRFGSAAEFLVALNQFGRTRAKQRRTRRARIGLGIAGGVAVVCALIFALHRRTPAAAAVAVAPPPSDGELVARYLSQLSEAPTCPEKRDALTHLRELGDRRALDGLHAVRSAKGLAKLRRCISRAEVDSTIRAIEGR
jgi:serine/threonine-protein kinase